MEPAAQGQRDHRVGPVTIYGFVHWIQSHPGPQRGRQTFLVMGLKKFPKRSRPNGHQVCTSYFSGHCDKIPHTSNLKEESFYLCSRFLGIQSIVVAWEAGSALGLRELAVCSMLRPVDQEGRKPGLE